MFEECLKENKSWFIWKVGEIASVLSIKPDWLMVVMYFESKLNSKAVNPLSGATGLIQFMPSTAQNLGTTTDELKQMSNVEQLDFVYKYLKPYKGKMKSWIDVYLAVFYPVAMGKGDDYKITNAKVVDQNNGFDINKDGTITVSEIKKKIIQTIPNAASL